MPDELAYRRAELVMNRNRLLHRILTQPRPSRLMKAELRWLEAEIAKTDARLGAPLRVVMHGE